MNKKKMKLIVDIDGTLCPIKTSGQQYIDLIPYPEMIEKLREYREMGAKIVLYTSRNMNSYDGNLGLINIYTAPVILEWLERWNIPYDELLLGKPWPGHLGYYVDDRAIRPKEFLNHTMEELDEICTLDRL